MNLSTQVHHFIQSHRHGNHPFLLALSGGADSLSLFYCLLEAQIPFHIAHVDHGWRPESELEAKQLAELAQVHAIPFHLKKLNPSPQKGNLEANCREERYAFFKGLCNVHDYQGVILGHHADDRAETVLKRLLEGSHWTSLSVLRPTTTLYEMKILRPLHAISKNEIVAWLKEQKIVYFEDATNEDARFLRGRMRTDILPWLSEAFGKEVKYPLLNLAEDASEWHDFINERISPYLKQIIKGKFGLYLDLSDKMPDTAVEIKHLIRIFCHQERIILSREALESATIHLQKGSADRCFICRDKKIHVDRKKIFMTPLLNTPPPKKQRLEGSLQYGNWRIKIEPYTNQSMVTTDWKGAWMGKMEAVLPLQDYWIGPPEMGMPYHQRSSRLGKWLTDYHVPTFLRSFLPVIGVYSEIYHEFLTGKSPKIETSSPALRISLEYC